MANRFSVEAIFKAIDRFTAPVAAMQARMGRFTRSMAAGLKTVDNAINKTTKGLLGAGKTLFKWGGVALGLVTAGLVGIVGEFSRIENARAAFTPLLGSVDRAKELVADLNKLMVDTPFEFDALTDAAKQLLPVMNGDLKKTVDTIKMLGDTAGGNAQKLETITRGFTKAMLKGKVDLESLNMIAEAGVPIFTELAASMGKKVNPAFFKMISAGKVTTAQLTAAFERMTTEGGIFFNGMVIASKTTSALWSGFMDNVRSTAAVIGEELDPYVKELLGYMTALTQRLREWVTLNKDFIQTKLAEYVGRIKIGFENFLESLREGSELRGYLTALLDSIIWIGKGIAFLVENAEHIWKIIKMIIVLTTVFKIFSAILAVVNLLMLANPIGLIVIGIGLAIAAVAALIIWFDDLKAAFENAPTWVKVLFYPITLLIEAFNMLSDLWAVYGEDFKDFWSGMVDAVTAAYEKIKPILNALGAVFGGAFNLGVNIGNMFSGADTDDSGQANSIAPKVVSPQEREARLIEESRTTSYAELLIKDTTGKAELNRRGQAPGVSFSMVPTGTF